MRPRTAGRTPSGSCRRSRASRSRRRGSSRPPGARSLGRRSCDAARERSGTVPAGRRQRPIWRTACRSRWAFSTRARRRKPSPVSPKPRPGLTATSASSSSFMAKSIEPICDRQGSGMADQTNIPARGASTSQPSRRRPRTRTSRRDLVLGDLGQPALLAVPQGDDRGDLHGLEDPVVVIALDRLEGAQHLAVAGREADPPAGHVVALGHRRELAADALGPLDRQEARRLVAVEADVAVGEVVDHEEAVLLRQRDDLLEEGRLDDRGRRVVRVVQDQDLGPRDTGSRRSGRCSPGRPSRRGRPARSRWPRPGRWRGRGSGSWAPGPARCRRARAGPGTCG